MAPKSSRPDTRGAVLSAALELFSQHGVEASSTAELCRVAQVSNGSLFHLFPTRGALALALYVDVLRGYHRGVLAVLRRSRSTEAAVRALVAHEVKWTLEHPREARYLNRLRQVESDEPLSSELAAEHGSLLGEVSSWLEPRQQGRQLRALPLPVTMAIALGPIRELARQWLREGDDARLKRAVPALADAAWRALRPEPSRR